MRLTPNKNNKKEVPNMKYTQNEKILQITEKTCPCQDLVRLSKILCMYEWKSSFLDKINNIKSERSVLLWVFYQKKW